MDTSDLDECNVFMNTGVALGRKEERGEITQPNVCLLKLFCHCRKMSLWSDIKSFYVDHQAKM